MKNQLCPSQLLERGRVFPFGGVCQELMDTPTSVAIGLTAQQTPPPVQGGAYTLCEVCNLQLTSAAQAQLHYNSRSHLRRVRQLRSGETKQQIAGGAQSRFLLQAAGLNRAPGLSSGLRLPASTAAGKTRT
ncbi:hypothetical protein LDENG_00248310 [Lucifuga dentata]|nr:hypothetical protein LDENG_00248310 [Lucifuga dentata]